MPSKRRPRNVIDRALDVAREKWPESKPHVALAYHMGVTTATVYHWLSIGGVPQTQSALALSELTGIPVADFCQAIESNKVA
jgi:acetyl-CoA acetyltransferase